ncbi:integral membrane protein [Pleomassaria siparia CBS 279.74]|uniref:Integral membrane protein n=1 Tax=Pleomassaria siparia CBS 279.74 TaxID=1314801 RepID=A0A6G1KQ96_9PLEO|nr:integral membrane protein [Pleomassaria siparia CBS 279.74]
MATLNVEHEQARQDTCTGVATAMTVVSIIIVCMRTYARTIVVRCFGIDDWMMLVALLFTIGYLIAIWILRDNGMGFSGSTLSLEQMTNIVKTTLAIEIMYYIVIFTIKASILFFYLRIAAEKMFTRACQITIAVLGVFCGVCVICCLTQCIPIRDMWNFTGVLEGKCINTTALFYFTSSFNILADIWILALPIKTLMSIQRPKGEKIALIVIFSLGVFSCIASIVRLHSIRIYTESKDPFYDSVPINVWSMIEINIGILCASMPAVKAIFVQVEARTGSRSTGYQYHSHGKSGTLGETPSNRSQGSLHALEEFGLKSMHVESPLEHRRMVAKKKASDMDLDSVRTGSQEEIIHIRRDTDTQV